MAAEQGRYSVVPIEGDPDGKRWGVRDNETGAVVARFWDDRFAKEAATEGNAHAGEAARQRRTRGEA